MFDSTTCFAFSSCKRLFIFLGFLQLICVLPEAYAFPWDIDMYRQPSLKTNEIARAPVEGTVPLGYDPFTLSIEEAAQSLNNPIPVSRDSAWRGQRVYNANCWTCHGKLGDGQGPVGPQLAVPTLLNDFYRGKPDGEYFAVLHYGLRNMPRYGFKLSTGERWDVINYLRVLQGTEVEGMDAALPK